MAEKRLIDAMQTVTKLSGRITPLIQEGANPMRVYNEVLEVIAEATTVDAVECVRCKDCKHYLPHPKSERRCCYVHITTPHFMLENGFCSYGERRTDG